MGTPGEPPDQPVGQPGRNLSEEQLVLPLLTPSANQVVPLVQLRDQCLDIPRVVLQVAVERDDHLAPSVVEAGHHGGGLTHVCSQPQAAHPWIGGYRAHLVPGPVPAAVVYQNDLERALVGLQCLKDPLHERAHVLRLVVERSDH